MSIKRYSMPILSLAVVGSFSLIYYVHKEQESERERLHDGVVRDLERQKYKMMMKKNNVETNTDSSVDNNR